MLSCVKCLFSTLVVGYFLIEHVENFCFPRVPPVIAGTIKLPNRLEILPLRVFDSEGPYLRFPAKLDTAASISIGNTADWKTVVGPIWHSMYNGVAPQNDALKLIEKTELMFVRPSPNIVRVEIKAEFNGTCIYEDLFGPDEFDVIRRPRSEFLVSSTGTYLAVFSSDPNSYIWVLLCFLYEDGMRRCPAENLSFTIYTRDNPPDNVNLEMIGRDLRKRTCLTMEEISDEFIFVFNQGNNTCPDDGVL